MKLQKDYKEVSEKFKHFYESYKAETLEHVKEVKNRKEYNNLEVRIAFDIARASGEEVELYDSICKLTKDEKTAIKIFAIVCKLAGVKTAWEL